MNNSQMRWHAMYLGAFVALHIGNAEIARDLAELTTSDEEAIRMIERLRDGRAGDRTWPVLDALWSKRAGGL